MKSISSRFSTTVSSLSLRTRLVLGHMIVTFLAVAGLGYYVCYRIQQQNAYLTNQNAIVTDQLNKSDLQQASDKLIITGSAEANELDNFFTSTDKDVNKFGVTTGILLSQEAPYGNGTYWDASQALGRLPNGNWDNSKSDIASVFMPSKVELTAPLIAELNTLMHLNFVAPAILKSNPDDIAVYFGGASGEVIYYPNIDLANQVPPDYDVTQRPWYVSASPARDQSRQAVWSEPYQDSTHHGLVMTVSAPVYEASGEFRGVVAMDVSLAQVTQIISNTKIGQTGNAFLIDQNQRLIARNLGEVTSPPQLPSQLATEFSTALNNANAGKSGVETMQVNGAPHFIAYFPVPTIGYSLLIAVPSQDLLTTATAPQAQIAQATRNTLILSVFLILGILVVSLLASFAVGNALMSPLTALTRTAEEITAGNLAVTAEVKRRDEIGAVANALNTMTSTLRENIQSFEQRVMERAPSLKEAPQIEDQRAAQFEAIALIVKAINSVHQMDELLPQITSVISERFGYYHVGIFLNDESDQTAVLAAANSEGGKHMLERGHRLKIGEQGIVGYVASTGAVRIAHNVGEDAIYFNNPDLPETRSEMALPLRLENQIVGILDVQSKQTDAFSPEDVGVLSLLADEVSLAIDNTRLLESTRRSLSEAEALYRQYLRQAWSRLPREENLVGYRHTVSGSSPLDRPIDLNAKANGENKKQEEADRLVVPIKLRGELIGNIIIQNPQAKKWSRDQLDFVQAVADRVALSSENARLFDETSRRAERERMVTEITSKIRSTNSPKEMINVALNELRSALGATQVQLIPQTASAPKDDETAETFVVPPKVIVPKNGNGANQ
jgi:GAF domain-containing protein/HAMP domain-containing protein